MNFILGGIFFVGIWLVVLTGIQALPLLALALAPGLVQTWFIDADKSERLIRATASPAVKAKVAQLQALGFELLGIRAEKIWWRKPIHEIAFTAVDADTFGSIILNQNQKAADLYLYTPFAGDGLVFTRGPSRLPEMESETISVKNLPLDKPERLAASHRQRVRDLKKKGLTPLAVVTPADRLAAARIYYASAYGRRAGRTWLGARPVRNFLVLLALFVAAGALFAYRLFLVPGG